MSCSINICRKVANISTEFETNNTELKKDYIIKNIELYNGVVKKLDICRGSFGTGYPFYALNKDMGGGTLPIIEEQLRYNDELLEHVNKSHHLVWHCANCLEERADTLPDLKQICKPCPSMDDELKPRKIINRLPDIDMWMVCNSSNVSEAKEKLIELFDENNMYPSDINPMRTISDVEEIVNCIKRGYMPDKNLPLDAHIIDYETLYSLMEEIPEEINASLNKGKLPYLPIHPYSYRKKWQHDDMAYNFIMDFLYTFTEFDFDDELQEKLESTRTELVNNFSTDDLYSCVVGVAPDSVKRRLKNKVLEKRLEERLESWKK